METSTSPVRSRADLMTYPTILRQADLARAFGVSRQTILNRQNAGTLLLEPVNVADGGKYLWMRTDLEKHMFGIAPAVSEAGD